MNNDIKQKTGLNKELGRKELYIYMYNLKLYIYILTYQTSLYSNNKYYNTNKYTNSNSSQQF